MVGLTACTETKLVAEMARDKSSSADAQPVQKIEADETAAESEYMQSEYSAFQPFYTDNSAGRYCGAYGSGASATAYVIAAFFAYAIAGGYGGAGSPDSSSSRCSH